MSVILFSVDDPATSTTGDLVTHSEAWARELVSQQWLTAWPLVTDVVGILEREPSSLPPTGAYSACSFRFVDERQMTQGARPRFECRGVVEVRIWTPDGNGGMQASQLADLARGVFTRKQLSSADTVEALMTFGSETPTQTLIGKWHQQMLAFPCRWYRQQQ